MLANIVQPQDAYGLEKLASEEIAKHYQSDFNIQTRVARFHNIYGPYGTWKGKCVCIFFAFGPSYFRYGSMVHTPLDASICVDVT